jgi:hypothetical protein
MWGALKAWLLNGCIPDSIMGIDESFPTELSNPTYGFNNRDEIQLEKKQDMRRRGVSSPNAADALALTFAMPIFEPTNLPLEDETKHRSPDWDPYSEEFMYA